MSFFHDTRQTHYYAVFDDTLDAPRREDKSYVKGRYKIVGLTYKKHAPYTSRSHEVVPWYSAFRPAVTMGELNRGMRMPMRVESPFLLAPKRMVVKQESGAATLIVMWRTRTSLWYELRNEWIPVMGLSNPSLLHGNYIYEADGDTREECSARQVIQMTERMRAQAVLNGEEVVDEEWVQQRASAPPAPPVQPSQEESDLLEAIRRSLESVVPAPVSPPLPPPPPAPLPPRAQPVAAPPSFAPRYVLELLKRDAVQKGDACPISMTPFGECASTSVTCCFHLFETEAIQAWLCGHITCPVCKQTVTAAVIV